MKLFVTVKTNSKKPGVEQIDSSHFIVRVREAPIDGQANEAIVEALAIFLKIPPRAIKILAGHKAKRKILSI